MKQNLIKLNSIEEGIKAIKNGEVIIVVDDAIEKMKEIL
jgi:3,4-dihydroxy-2-butanone 4-phosphate synthase